MALNKMLSLQLELQIIQKHLLTIYNNLSNVLLTKGGTSQYNLNRIFRLQKRSVKIIVNYQYDNFANIMDEL